METCLFCSIGRGSIPAEKVYEDTDTIAFLDINPNNPGHTLVIPKKHVENIYTADDATLGAVMHTVRILASAVKRAVAAEGINVHFNNEPAAGQVIFHLHAHVIPRFATDGHTHFGHKPYKDGEAAAVAQKIRGSIALHK